MRNRLTRPLTKGNQRSWIALATVALALLAACDSSPKGGKLGTAPVPVAAQAAAPTPTPQPSAPAGSAVVGVAELPGGPFAGATVKAFRPGSTTPIATGLAGADGRFGLALGAAVPEGTLLKLVATQGDKTLASMVAAGAGNLVAAGAGNMVAAGAGNMVAAGAGNLVAAGAGNLVAAGAGNFTGPRFGVLASTPGEVKLNVATTVAVAALGKRLESAAGATAGSDGDVLDDLVAKVLAAFEKFSDEAFEALAASGDDELAEALLSSLDANGNGTLNSTFADTLAASNEELKATFAAVADALGDALAAASAAGNEVTGGTGAITFAGQTSGDVNLTSGTTQPGTTPTAPEPGTEPTTTSGSTSGGSSSGGSNEEEELTESNGAVTIGGNFTLPSPIAMVSPSPPPPPIVVYADDGLEAGWTFADVAGGATVDLAFADPFAGTSAIRLTANSTPAGNFEFLDDLDAFDLGGAKEIEFQARVASGPGTSVEVLFVDNAGATLGTATRTLAGTYALQQVTLAGVVSAAVLPEVAGFRLLVPGFTTIHVDDIRWTP